jgi:hypothetical protein
MDGMDGYMDGWRCLVFSGPITVDSFTKILFQFNRLLPMSIPQVTDAADLALRGTFNTRQGSPLSAKVSESIEM